MSAKPPLLLIEWEDSCTEDAWRGLDGKEDGPTLCRSVGWLIHEAKGFVTLGGSLLIHDGRPSQACSRMTIPKGVIRKRERLNG